MTSAKPRRNVPPYSRLARLYDEVMAHIDYEDWATFIASLIERHHPGADRILELACGTGSLAYHLQPMGGFEYYATDSSSQMIDVARNKQESAVTDVSFAIRDFRQVHDIELVDVVLLLYDGLNYIIDEEDISDLLDVMYHALRPNGIAIFDQSTPANSIDHEYDFDDAGEAYKRKSRYDADSNIHTTIFEVQTGEAIEVEIHRQRAYELDTIRKNIDASGFELLEALDERTRSKATPTSHRVHWVVRKPEDLNHPL